MVDIGLVVPQVPATHKGDEIIRHMNIILNHKWRTWLCKSGLIWNTVGCCSQRCLAELPELDWYYRYEEGCQRKPDRKTGGYRSGKISD